MAGPNTVPQQTLSFVKLSNTIRLTNDVLMLDHRLQLWPNINPAFAQHIAKNLVINKLTVFLEIP